MTMMAETNLILMDSNLLSMDKTIQSLYDQIELFLLVEECWEDSWETLEFDIQSHNIDEALQSKV